MKRRLTYAKAEDMGQDALRHAKDYADKAYTSGYQLVDEFQKSYPALVHDARELSHNASIRAKKAYKIAGDRASHAAEVVGKQLHRTERKLIKVGVIYAIYRLFTQDNEIASARAAELKEHIHENPVQSAVIALGAGYILGKLFR